LRLIKTKVRLDTEEDLHSVHSVVFVSQKGIGILVLNLKKKVELKQDIIFFPRDIVGLCVNDLTGHLFFSAGNEVYAIDITKKKYSLMLLFKYVVHSTLDSYSNFLALRMKIICQACVFTLIICASLDRKRSNFTCMHSRRRRSKPFQYFTLTSLCLSNCAL
jgi:hypothetical protein